MDNHFCYMLFCVQENRECYDLRWHVESYRTKSQGFCLFLTNSIRDCPYNNCEKGDEMYYEVYVDSLFLVNFVMNLYLLLLVNQSTFRTATRLRLILGAAVGAIGYLSPFLWNGPRLLKYGLGLFGGTLGMLYVTFRMRSFRALGQLLGKLCLWSFLIGGILLFLIGKFTFLRDSMTGIAGVLGMGTVVYLFLTFLLEKYRNRETICHVTLINGESRIKVAALLDSGNSLVEPISGKSVSIIEMSVFQSLWRTQPPYYRVIPFHSIGKNRGILRGYLLPEIQIETDGVIKVCKDVYIAVSNENITGMEAGSGIKMILNPMLLRSESA